MRSIEIDCITIWITIRVIASTNGIITPIYVRHYEALLLEPCQVEIGKTIKRHELDLLVQRSVQLEYIEFKFKFNKGLDFMNFS
jgi:hypothetical protein